MRTPYGHALFLNARSAEPRMDARRLPAMGYDAPVTLTDRFIQLAYRCAYQLVRLLWAILRPTTHGALIVVWKEGKLLLVRNSYVPHYSPPGGYIRGGETASQAAVRELAEETHLVVLPAALRQVHEETHQWEFRRDHVTIFAVEVTDPVQVEVDHREVISADFYSPEDALKLLLFPPLRRFLEKLQSDPGAVASSRPLSSTKGINARTTA